MSDSIAPLLMTIAADGGITSFVDQETGQLELPDAEDYVGDYVDERLAAFQTDLDEQLAFYTPRLGGAYVEEVVRSYNHPGAVDFDGEGAIDGGGGLWICEVVLFGNTIAGGLGLVTQATDGSGAISASWLASYSGWNHTTISFNATAAGLRVISIGNSAVGPIDVHFTRLVVG